jgi:cellulose synthase/poly-beta-1,6-N-acetylglucosamine synthase-like glycosyltransferase
MNSLADLTVYGYFALLLLLSVYGIHRYFILFLYFKHYKRKRHAPPPAMRQADYPSVTVQLPLYNEMYVAERIVEAAGELRYPGHLLTIQVLDDSTDGSEEISRAAVERLRARGLNAQWLHRTQRDGFKAGALKAGLEQTSDELVAIFDADFVPPPDFLERVVPHFHDPRVGMVQTRWGYLNKNYSLLTRLQSILLDGHFMLEHTARYFSGRFFNFNGTGGMFRRTAIIDAGGWEGDTLTEDLDLSYRAQMRGWKFVYLPDVVVPSELPVDIYGFKTQQHRWTKGSIQVGKKLLPALWRTPIPFKVKLEATFHLTANYCYVLLVLLSALMPLSIMYRYATVNRYPLIEITIFLFTTGSISLFYLISQRELYRDWKWRLKDVPFIMALGIGMCLNNAWAVLEAVFARETPFVRTAKYRIESLKDSWKGKLYRTVSKKFLIMEFLFAAYMMTAVLIMALLQNWGALPYVFLFVIGYTYIFGLSLLHSKR